MKTTLVLTAVLFSTRFGEATADSNPPDWYIEEIELLTAGSGRWEADNSAYMNEKETFDTYVTEWRTSFDGLTMTGRLFGVVGGKESADFWEFRQYWHPVQQEVVIEQFGRGGAIGVGTMWREDRVTVSDQAFAAPDGRRWRGGHRSYFPDKTTHVTDSYAIEGEEWIERRSYRWLRVTTADSER